MSYQGKWMCPIQDVPTRSDSQGEWMRLQQLICPARECGSRASVSWVCGLDGNSVYLNEHGEVKCSLSEYSDGIHIGDVSQSGWKCGNSLHKDQYHSADFRKFQFALSDALQFSGERSAMWLTRLISSLGRQFNK